jgi:hypothetical protein
VCNQAIREFNALFSRHRLGVTLSRTTQSGGTAANVVAEAPGDHISCSYAGTPVSESFDSSRMRGRTFTLAIEGRIEKAFVFLPIRPMVNTPRGVRAVGTKLMNVIAVYEFVHTCGLSNDEHAVAERFLLPQVTHPMALRADRASSTLVVFFFAAAAR